MPADKTAFLPTKVIYNGLTVTQFLPINRQYNDSPVLCDFLNMQVHYRGNACGPQSSHDKKLRNAAIDAFTAKDIVPKIKSAWNYDRKMTESALRGFCARLHQGENENLVEIMDTILQIPKPESECVKEEGKEFMKRLEAVLTGFGNAELVLHENVSWPEQRDHFKRYQDREKDRILARGTPFIATIQIPTEYPHHRDQDEVEKMLDNHELKAMGFRLGVMWDGEAYSHVVRVCGKHESTTHLLRQDHLIWAKEYRVKVEKMSPSVLV